MTISQRTHHNLTTTHLSAPELYTCKGRGENQKPSWHSGRVQYCIRDIPSSNPDEDKKKISHRTHQNYNTNNPSKPKLNAWNSLNKKSLWQSPRLEIQWTPFQIIGWGKKDLSQVQSEQFSHQSLCNRAEYLKLSEVKTRSHLGTLVRCRTRDPEVTVSFLLLGKRKSFTGPITPLPPSIPLHQCLILEIVRGRNQKLLWQLGGVQD